MKKRFIVEIEVDEAKCMHKYPNFMFNYQNIDEFIESEMLCCNSDSDSWKRWGYRKKVIKEIK